MPRLNFTFDDESAALLEELAERYYGGNKSRTVRAGLESLAAHVGHDGWVIAGHTPVQIDDGADCHSCGTAYEAGTVLFRPVFERGQGPEALDHIPSELWLDCPECVEDRDERATA